MRNNIEATKTYIKNLFHDSSDITIEEHQLFNPNKSKLMIVVYCNGLMDNNILRESILPSIQNSYYYNKNSDVLLNCTLSLKRNELQADQVITENIFNGLTAIFIDETIYFYNTSNPPKRSPEESNAEVSLRGPRDGFVEDISTNVALVRKRLKTNSLVIKSFKIGKRSQTKVYLAYIYDIENEAYIQEVTKRLESINIDMLISDNQLLGELGDSKYPLFPLLGAYSRPDGVASSLVRGRFAIFIDNVPNVLVAPGNLGLFLNTSEDVHVPYYYATFEYLLRLMGLLLSLFLPGFWLALSAYNVDQIPFPLLATIASARLGIPFNTAIELLLMITLFELFREAGIRLPKPVGQTVAVVGGLIVGDAAIRAGLTSPTMLVVAAITAVATFSLGNQALFGSVSIIRYFSILITAILGMFGFFISLFFVLGYLAKLESFGIPYLSPVSPFVRKDFAKILFRFPAVKQNMRSRMLKTIDRDRQGDS